MENPADALAAPVAGAIDDTGTAPHLSEPSRERRRDLRYPTDRLTFVHLQNSLGIERVLCRVLDVSEGGMRLRTELPIATGIEIRVTLREMFAVATVRYCRQVDGGFDHGVRVVEIRSLAASLS